MDRQALHHLIEKVNEGRATEEELLAYNVYMNRLVNGPLDWEKDKLPEDDRIRQEIWTSIHKEINPPVRRLWPRIAVAASLILAFSTAAYLFFPRSGHTDKQLALTPKNQVSPGRNGAILTLANGQKLVLEQIPIGSVNTQQGALLKKTNDSSLTYQPVQAEALATLSFNTLEVPRGRQFSVILPDGTKVWLNAASSLQYPTAFSGHERLVRLTGEAYFEVAHQDKAPFKIATKDALIEDIGTHFNVNAYSDEPDSRTTLLEGAVRVSAGSHQLVLAPGKQAVISNGKLTMADADVRESISWKNGFFTFKKANIQTVMRQFSRWYDINVKYEGGIPDVELTGDVYRNTNAEKALKILSYFGISYKFEGKTILITR